METKTMTASEWRKEANHLKLRAYMIEISVAAGLVADPLTEQRKATELHFQRLHILLRVTGLLDDRQVTI